MAVIVLLAATMGLSLWPPSNDPSPVDAVEALAGGAKQRLAVAGEIAAAEPGATLCCPPSTTRNWMRYALNPAV